MQLSQVWHLIPPVHSVQRSSLYRLLALIFNSPMVFEDWTLSCVWTTINMWSRSSGAARCWISNRLTLRCKSCTATLSVCQENINYVPVRNMCNAGCPSAPSHSSQCAASMFFWLFWPTTVTYVTVCCVNTNRAERAETAHRRMKAHSSVGTFSLHCTISCQGCDGYRGSGVKVQGAPSWQSSR